MLIKDWGREKFYLPNESGSKGPQSNSIGWKNLYWLLCSVPDLKSNQTALGSCLNYYFITIN